MRAAVVGAWLGASLLATSLTRASPDAGASPERILSDLGLPAPWQVVAFVATPEVERFARESVAGHDGVLAKADAIYERIRALKGTGAIVADRDNSPKARHPKTAGELLAIARSSASDVDRHAGCYELSALFIAMARSLGLDAFGVEPLQWSGTGQIGHIMAGVRDRVGERVRVYDLQNDRRTSAGRTRPVSDRELAAHHYNHLAVAAFLRGDLRRARFAIDVAMRLAPAGAPFANNRAAIGGALGDLPAAIADATYAVALAPRVPLYRYQLGRLRLAAGDLHGARAAFSHAQTLRPGYGLAQRDQGWAHLLEGDLDTARRLLQAAAHDTAAPGARAYLALAHLVAGDSDAARAALEGATGQPDDLERAVALLIAGRVETDRVRRLATLVAAVRRRVGQ